MEILKNIDVVAQMYGIPRHSVYRRNIFLLARKCFSDSQIVDWEYPELSVQSNDFKSIKSPFKVEIHTPALQREPQG